MQPVDAGELSAAARLGERIFSDPRFAYAGSGVSCAACHQSGATGAARARLFDDPVAVSAVPSRNDGSATTPRNTPPLVGALAAPSEGWGLLHWDGEFATTEDLVTKTFVGRNLCWLPEERAEAVRHFAKVIRADDGRGPWGAERPKLPYAVLLGGVPEAPAGWRLPEHDRIEVARATDDEVLAACARLVAAYLQTLRFARDAEGRHSGSPYDAFLELNRLPRAPAPGESPIRYARRLHEAVAALKVPRYVDDQARRLALHDQPFRFGELELKGMRIFFRGALGYGQNSSSGNCAECHTPPHFTDFAFHNTGAAQDGYDAVHGAGAFERLFVPNLTERAQAPDRWLPPSAPRPKGSGVFRAPISAEIPGRADLGLWNVYGNPDLPALQPVIERKLNPEGRLSSDEVLAFTLGRFKTPSLRSPGQSAPYLHNGRLGTMEEVLDFYRRMSDLSREGKMRNAPREYHSLRLQPDDIAPLAAFLRALNEDYE